MDERRTDQERNGGASQARTWPLPGNGDPHRTTLGHVGNDGSPQTSRGQATRSSHHQNSRISPEQHEPTKLLDLRRQYNETHPNNPLTSQQLARLARVSERDEYVVEIGGTISKETALSVLDAFNVFTGSKVSLQSIKITIVDAEHREPMPRFALFGDAEGGLTWRG